MPDQDLVGAKATDLGGGRGGDAKDNVGAPRNLALDEVGARLLILGVGMAGGLAGAALDRDRDLLVGGEGLDHVGDERDTALSHGCLFRHSDLHRDAAGEPMTSD